MAEQPAADQSSTPTTSTDVTPTAVPATPPVAQSTTPDSPAPVDAKVEPTPAVEAPKADTAPTTDKPAQAAAPDAPLFTPPEDLKLPPQLIDGFTGFLKDKVIDGKVTLTPQEVVDQFAALSRVSAANWQAQIKAQDTANEAACKAQFSPAQLETAKSAVAMLEGKSKGFRDWFQKTSLNNPVAVGALVAIGEAISEDTFLKANAPTPSTAKKSLKEALYGGKTN